MTKLHMLRVCLKACTLPALLFFACVVAFIEIPQIVWTFIEEEPYEALNKWNILLAEVVVTPYKWIIK